MALNEDQKTEALLATMSLLEGVDKSKAFAEQIQSIPFEALSRNDWAEVQEMVGKVVSLVELLSSGARQMVKVLDNDALMDHMQAVVLAEE